LRHGIAFPSKDVFSRNAFLTNGHGDSRAFTPH
jgi:hypothetical protein